MDAEFPLHVDGVGRERKAAFEHRHGLVEPPGPRQLNAMLEKCRRIWRSPRGGPAQLLDRLVLAPRERERRAEQGLDSGILAAPRGLFQRRDRLGAAVLHQQRLTEQLRRKDVAAIGLQYFGGDPLGLAGTLHPQCKARAFERLVAGVRTCGTGRKWRPLRHRP